MQSAAGLFENTAVYGGFSFVIPVGHSLAFELRDTCSHVLIVEPCCSGSNPCVDTQLIKKCRARRHFLINSGASRRIVIPTTNVAGPFRLRLEPLGSNIHVARGLIKNTTQGGVFH